MECEKCERCERCKNYSLFMLHKCSHPSCDLDICGFCSNKCQGCEKIYCHYKYDDHIQYLCQFCGCSGGIYCSDCLEKSECQEKEPICYGCKNKMTSQKDIEEWNLFTVPKPVKRK